MRPQTSAPEQTASPIPYLAMQALFPDRDRPIDPHENPDGTFSARLQTPTDYRSYPVGHPQQGETA